MKKFPAGFLFGASTSSHQTEGDCNNDWSEWEKTNAPRLAAEYSIQPGSIEESRFKKEKGSSENYISGKGVDHYNQFRNDFRLAGQIGLNAYRFSIEWSRIEPSEGVWNDEEINHYRGVIESLRSMDIEPFVTIWHWTLPLWLAESGGVLNPSFSDYFSRYASKLAESFADSIKFYIIINEPEIYSMNSYMLGKWPPQKKGLVNYFRSIQSLIKAHNLSYQKIRSVNPECRAGCACNMTFFESGGGALNNIASAFAEIYWNRYFIDKTIKSLDFIGVNYYFHNRIYYGLNRNENINVSDMGWELYPSGISRVIESLRRYKLPVYITENGLADRDDINRGWFITETLRSLYDSITNGADVKGYFHWSLLDNFEWDKGFWPRFGLISVDRDTMKRNIRGSAEIYSSIIRRGFDI